MTKRLPITLTLLLTTIWTLISCASSGWAGERGMITGKVRDSLNNINLMGVLVDADNGIAKTVTDRDGGYTLSLPAGEHTVTFSYLGYEPVTKTIDVSVASATALNIDFGESTVQMRAMVITGQAVGQAKALNQQKTAPNLKNIVASDAIGRFPDQNAAEALDRIPGVSIERDQGEGRFVIIRGIDPHLNGASVDGISLASADADTRAVLLDVLPMNVMETLVVTKALTADMPADSIGGHVDIITPSAYDRNERTLHGSIGGNYSDLTDDLTESGQVTFGDVLGKNNQFGVLASVSFDKREFGSDNVEADPWEHNTDGQWVTEELQFREYNLTRERMGVTTNLEFKPLESHNYFLRGLYGSYTDHEYRNRAVIGDMMMRPDSAGTGTIVGEDFEDDPGALFPTTEIQLKDREETQKNWAISAGGKHKLTTWTVDYKLAYSYAEQDTPFDTQFQYATEALNYFYAGADSDTPLVSASDGDIDDLGIYELDAVEDSTQLVEEESWIVSANIQKELNTAFQSHIKTGFHVTLRNKTNDLETFVYEDAPDQLTSLEGNTRRGRNAFSDFPQASHNLRERFLGTRRLFSSERDLEASVVEDYETDEDTYAGYILGHVDFGRFSLIPGIRMEYTEIDARGNTFDEDSETVGRQQRSHDYTNVLPSLHAKYRLTDNLLFYAAWTNTISRPQWEETRYGKFTDDDGNVEIGNPELDPYEAMNWDATLSYYMPGSLGIASIGFFFKDIDNFIYSQTSELEDYELTTFRNGEDGHIYGLELAYQQKLRFLPWFLNGFSVEGNLTLSNSEADLLATEAGDANRTVDFIRHSDTVGAVALSYEKFNFFLRLSGSYRSNYLDAIGENPSEDRYIDDHFQLDFSSSYTFRNRYTLYLNLVNLTDEPLKAYFGESGRLSQYEEYGLAARFGLKFNF